MNKPKCCFAVLFTLACAQPVFCQSGAAVFGLNFGFLSSGGVTYGYEILNAGIQAGLSLPLSQRAYINLMADTNFGVVVTDGISGHLGALVELQTDDFLISLGAGASNPGFGLFPLLLFLLALDRGSGNLFDLDDDYFPQIDSGSQPVIPYLRLSFSVNENHTSSNEFIGPTVFFEYRFDHGFRTGLALTFRSD